MGKSGAQEKRGKALSPNDKESIILDDSFDETDGKFIRLMRLTLRTDYALRTLMFVGLKAPELATIGEIVRYFEISRGHVMKVVHELGLKAYLENVRGKGGGIRLARKPEQINVGAVVRDMEEELGVLGCLQGEEGYCRIEECCVLRSALRDATNAFLAVLDKYTLADLLGRDRLLSQLLGLPPAAPSARARTKSITLP